jgi:hypothetical protein
MTHLDNGDDFVAFSFSPDAQDPTFVELSRCEYCGEIATTIDHLPPKVVRNRLMALGRFEQYLPFFRLIPACHECNVALGARVPFSFKGRKRYIKYWLKRRYGKYLRLPNWSDDDIAELGFDLKSSVRKALTIKRHAEARLSWRG